MYILFDLRQRAVKYMVSKLLNKYETFSGMGHGAEGGGGLYPLSFANLFTETLTDVTGGKPSVLYIIA